MEGTYDILNQNPQFVTTEPNRKVFAEMQIISYIFIILKHMAMCRELAMKGWRRYAFPHFISFILRYLSQTERYSQVLWFIWKLI